MYSVCDTLAGGFPHSEISGSKLICQLPEAYRRLSRPSSPVIAKASTTCTSSLDPITLTSTAVHAVKDASILPIDVMSMSRCAVLQALNRFKLKSGDAIKCCCWHGCAPSNSRSAPPATTLIRLYELLKNNSRSLRIAHANALTGHSHERSAPPTDGAVMMMVVVEDDGFEPTTPCLQSRCSPS